MNYKIMLHPFTLVIHFDLFCQSPCIYVMMVNKIPYISLQYMKIMKMEYIKILICCKGFSLLLVIEVMAARFEDKMNHIKQEN